MNQPSYASLTLPAGTTESTPVVFNEPFATQPVVAVSWEPEDVTVDVTEVTADGFLIAPSAPLDEPLEVLWLAIPTS